MFVAQLVRYNQQRVTVWTRLQDMTGLNYVVDPSHLLLVLATLVIVAFVAAALAGAWMLTHRPPPPLEWFAVATTALIVVVFMWPPGFFFHFPAFPGAVPRPVDRTARVPAAGGGPAGHEPAARAGRWPQWIAAGLACLAIGIGAVIQASSETALRPGSAPGPSRPSGGRSRPARAC